MSLAMNSANRLKTNKAMKIHSDHTPRRLARKLYMRRAVSGVTGMPRKRYRMGSRGLTGYTSRVSKSMRGSTRV